MEVVTAGTSVAFGGAGDDTFIATAISTATISGNSGTDTLALAWLQPHLGAVEIDIRAGAQTARAENGLEMTFSSIERIYAYTGDGNDTIYTGAQNDVVNAGLGDNLVDMGAGDDALTYTLGGQNTLEGGEGNDMLTVFADANPMYFIADGLTGGIDDGQLSQISGFESYLGYGSEAADTAAFWTGNDVFTGWGGNDTAAGRDGDDSMTGDDGNDDLLGDNGNDALFGGKGDDHIEGGGDDDHVVGGSGNDTLYGDQGNDRLMGGQGSDVVYGGDGDDRIYLYLGNDTVTGGTGADKFIFNKNETGNHLITDFESGVDQLRISTMLLQFGPGAGQLDPALLSTGAAVGSQAQFVLTYDSGTGISSLVWDPNGDDPAGGVYSMLRLEGEVTLLASDIFII